MPFLYICRYENLFFCSANLNGFAPVNFLHYFYSNLIRNQTNFTGTITHHINVFGLQVYIQSDYLHNVMALAFNGKRPNSMYYYPIRSYEMCLVFVLYFFFIGFFMLLVLTISPCEMTIMMLMRHIPYRILFT